MNGKDAELLQGCASPPSQTLASNSLALSHSSVNYTAIPPPSLRQRLVLANYYDALFFGSRVIAIIRAKASRWLAPERRAICDASARRVVSVVFWVWKVALLM